MAHWLFIGSVFHMVLICLCYLFALCLVLKDTCIK